uniref:L2 n=1 Tax=Ascaris lumbricoides TaxID=6252 RepID=A0A0M3HWB1_ASCLU
LINFPLVEIQSNYGITLQQQIHSGAAPPGINPSIADVYEQEYATTGQEVTQTARSIAPNDGGVPYTRLIRKRRNTSYVESSSHIADVDLPEQTLTVFGIEDGPPPTQQELETNGVGRIYVGDRSRTCFTNGKTPILVVSDG